MRADGGDSGTAAKLEGGVDGVRGLLLDVLDEGELREGEGGCDAGLVYEDNAEAGAEDGLWGGEVGEAEARGDVAVVEGTGGFGVAVDPRVVELLGGKVEDGSLVVPFGRGGVEAPAGSYVEGEAFVDAPVVLGEVLLDVIARGGGWRPGGRSRRCRPDRGGSWRGRFRRWWWLRWWIGCRCRLW